MGSSSDPLYVGVLIYFNWPVFPVQILIYVTDSVGLLFLVALGLY